eukprot:Plantae.Rhodophyta-Purpureofilum_apyrenoidigerum.ctg50293.p3 GENE.Plantae.Rhodophyta-Purpureofilum_apyrenoidigerum.ctg50293~~Plantae.Rhodophyta-Purpureofilum_apyrenoidigerum.ctg50293.p3  ORF type:complete len:119 (-),score=16.78 Plantae.Rhodophyta-Purpureofilum_apyrenoidigerum.ctg50293:129-485(-)
MCLGERSGRRVVMDAGRGAVDMTAFVSAAVVGRSVGVGAKECRLARGVKVRPGERMRARVNMSTDLEDRRGPAPPPKDSYVKLAMRNMVQQGGKAVLHFGMTASVMLIFFVGLAFLTK